MARTVAGLAGGVLILASAVMHSIFGWRALREHLATIHAPQDLMEGIRAGWHFGGVAMLALGIIVCDALWRHRRDPSVSLRPVGVVAAAYLLFGAAAMASSGGDPFFIVFLVPGALLAWAAWPARAVR